jgi:hypothetical protein
MGRRLGDERSRRGTADCILPGMYPIDRVTAELESLAPLRLAADWDVVGLLVGSRRPRSHA